ncbi:DUF1846 domain-containing protein [Candidatus Saccharibacteria bacterium]|nr:DUF1846 domain-containing protein [Candidatus Saccharibacteria bacterium]
MIKGNSAKNESNQAVCFDNEKYIKLQGAKIDERIKMFGNKLYLEFGGKILDDTPASRVFPGYRPGIKVEMLEKLKDKAEIIFCINAEHIEKGKMRADNNISYEAELLRLIDRFNSLGLPTTAVVITLYTGQAAAKKFKDQLERRCIKAYIHTYTKGYPTDIDVIVSREGYGAQAYIETTKPLVVVAAPGPNSGKLATCLSQLYHEHKRGVRAGYAKFETFPVWDLPLKHPVNVAYEAMTADLGDVNMIDSFHLEKYGKTAVNYNRDLLVFPVLKNILYKITGCNPYFSPTDMGVNMIGKCISNDKCIREAACDEVIRRYLGALCDYKNGIWGAEIPERIKILMDELGLNVTDRRVVTAAAKNKTVKKSNVVAIELADGQIVTGRDTDIMTAPAAAVINVIKALGGIEDKIHLLSPDHVGPMLRLKKDVYQETKLTLSDVLMALAASAAINETVELALSELSTLRGLEAHSTTMLSGVEITALKKLGLNITCTAEFAN